VGADGSLSVGGVEIGEVAEELGTPLFVYDEEHLRRRCREAVAAWGDGVAYGSKAFLCLAMARLVHEEGMCLDVATGGEMHVALAAGVPPDRLVLHGNNKSGEELSAAVRAGVGRIIVDSFDEIDRLESLDSHTAGAARPQVLVRVTPGIEAHTHEYIMTGQADSKFGFGLASGQAAEAVRRLRRSPAVQLVGIHAHIGSQIFLTESYEREIEALAGFFRPLGLTELCIGGGLGVAYVADEVAPSMARWAHVVHQACADHGIDPHTRITAEPGRSIVAAAGMTVYRVGTIKEIPGVRTYVSVDGGMSDNPRPVLYGSGYEAFLPRCATAARDRIVTIVGKHCESGDFIIRNADVPRDITVGDFLVTPVTGAYGHSMASNYNKVTRPAVAFLRNGSTRLVVRRETPEDLLRLDVG
jgi:diaminopimelate decarboxylase